VTHSEIVGFGDTTRQVCNLTLAAVEFPGQIAGKLRQGIVVICRQWAAGSTCIDHAGWLNE
jgi:hypothetical protein